MAGTRILQRDFQHRGSRLCEAPLVHLIDDVVSPSECAHIIEIAAPKMNQARVSGVAGVRYSSGRSNTRTWVRHTIDEEVWRVAERVAALVALPLAHAESLQVIHYSEGQEYRPHFDAYDLTTEKGQRYCERGGQRLVTALIYLCDVEEGGETGFPRLSIDVAPRRGRLLVFHNCFPGTTTRDPRAYHQGKPPRCGDKWAFNLWFHERPY
ncbi:MAG TPA: 2OG-Fe(II) oxygenase [Nannocystis exedens]|nr:2OG-Fe(II) oxygenase [Nannocystis exedens]